MKDRKDSSGKTHVTVTLTVGTAGHIDHGKTELIKYLTGCDCDRLPEEKARGMTIDIGFATCELPDHRRVGIVDVPGHERFIHNMVAGAAGIDAVLLVVAADDGVMPQTFEHFHIVRLLGIRSGMVVINKTDLASPERVLEVERQVRDMAEGSFLETCPVLPMSARTGDGFAAFYDAFVAMVDRTAERDAGGPFRLHVERSFILKGLGTIVSGIPQSGSVRVGDTLVVLPGGKEKRVRAIQVYGVDADEGKAGECLALRLSDVSSGEIQRGAVLAAPGYFIPTRFVNARFQMLPGLKRVLKPRTAVRFHVGTDDVPGYMVLPEAEPLKPGSESYVQFQLKRPVVAAPGDFFVVRLLSPIATLGGGYVLAADTMKMRRSRGTWEAECEKQEMAFRSTDAAVAYALEQAGEAPLTVAELATAALVNRTTAEEQLARLVQSGQAVELAGGRYTAPATVGAAANEILRVLGGMHDAEPLSIGFPRKTFLPKLTAARPVVEYALQSLLESHAVARTASGYQRVDRAPKLSEEQAKLADTIEETYRREGYGSPRIDQLPEFVGAPAAIIKPIVDHLLQHRSLVKVDPKVVLHREVLERSRAMLQEWFAQHETIDVGEYKTLLGTSRKFAIPILEYWDREGVTRRVGNHRILRESQP